MHNSSAVNSQLLQVYQQDNAEVAKIDFAYKRAEKVNIKFIILGCFDLGNSIFFNDKYVFSLSWKCQIGKKNRIERLLEHTICKKYFS